MKRGSIKRRTGTGPGAVPQQAMERYLSAISAGVAPGIASVRLGVTKTTVYRWLSVGESATSGAQRIFWEATMRAKDEGLCDRSEELARHSKTDYRATVEWLRREDRRDIDAEIRKQELRIRAANADIAEMRGAILKAAAKGEVKGVVLSPVDFLDLIEAEDVRAAVAQTLKDAGLGLMVMRDLTKGATDDEMAEATGLGRDGALPLIGG